MATPKPPSCSPIGTNNIIIGVSIDHATTQRVVDRGPPSDSHNDVSHFLSLWGEKAQLRRFKDGAIVYAVVWDEKQHSYQNKDKWGGGYVEDIVEYLLKRHHPCEEISVSFTSILSTIDTMVSMRESTKPNFDPFSSHKKVMNAFESLCSILRQTSFGIPLQIDAVEPLSPALRYSELFPPVPHPFLGHNDASMKNVSGALAFNPILVQLKFAPSSKWPTDLKAIGAAKAAMLLQLADGIEKLGDKDFDGLLAVNTSHIYIGYQGYCFMLMIAADAEMDLLRRLSRPSASALDLLRELNKRHVLASRHHSTVHAVHTLYPSSGSVVRLARRWADSHLLSGHLSTELIELLVAKVYSDSSVFVKPPCSVPVGFLRFLQLLETFDWAR
jgi:U3 small nucleolar RNA-associated protein 22